MGNLSVTASSANSGATQSEATGGDSVSQNAFMIIVNIMLKDMDAQNATINLGMDRENLLKSGFDAQNKNVAAAESKLKTMIAESAKVDPNDMEKIQSDMYGIQAQMSEVQAQESKLAGSRNLMTQAFTRDITPAQTAIQQDSIMFGGAVHSFMLSEQTKL